MLKLKKIQILGFKSFCDRTELTLPGQGMAAVVGPNGCGKSNILDAVSWVLGEQSARTLRGTKMEDVIFAGTRDRKALGMAEVSLTLIDPDAYGEGPLADESLPAEERMDGSNHNGNGTSPPTATGTKTRTVRRAPLRPTKSSPKPSPAPSSKAKSRRPFPLEKSRPRRAHRRMAASPSRRRMRSS